MRTLLLSFFVLGLVVTARAEVSLPAIFKDHMVLQRDRLDQSRAVRREQH